MDSRLSADMVRAAKLVLWDFDGVIKESVAVKTRAFAKLFEPFGREVVERVTRHHQANGGMSRFEKIPLYLQFAGETPSEAHVNRLCEEFGELVLQAVIAAPWVPGAERYLRESSQRQLFSLVSATPQEELETILEALKLEACFRDVFGAPTTKRDAVRMTLDRHGIPPGESVMIGDAGADLDAARANDVPFVLRRHADNAEMFQQYTGPSLDDLASV